jgi:hypothetical protein
MVLTPSRIKAKLRSGEMAVSGDQWPIFVYQGYTYDPEDPWNGLLRSTILVSVSVNDHFLIIYTAYVLTVYDERRDINIYLRLQALWRKSPKRRDLATHASTA